ncbi:MAG: tRNA 2-thiouridine(34) synthase MnmA [Candidatus Coatesbacteria bacterium]|nr:MAG: tRNA 2-thiouridine(34) synthase MnmA [Candidatus Coatesbacteria bacterium]
MVAMSGGVDSAAAAVILAREGHDVVGVTMRLLDATARRGAGCCSPEALRVAAETARRIGVDHYVLDLRREFEESVINDFIDEYESGRTPNPCVLCNTIIKFDVLLKKARVTGFDGLATGHYARLNDDKTVISKAADRAKDQTYFLWGTPAAALGRLYFPVGGYTKGQVRRVAGEFLPDADIRPESQDVCFVGEDVEVFLAETIKAKPGPVTDVEGKILGEHDGLGSHTIGRRRGLGVATGEPMYVREIIPAENRLVVAPAGDMYASRLTATGANWLAEPPGSSDSVSAHVRYRDPGAPATVEIDGDRLIVDFGEPRRAVAPGQSVVFYRGDVLMGGAVIESVVWDD